MKLWTIQNIDAYEKFKNTGFLRANENFIYDDMTFHYNWVVAQMKKRIGPPPSKEIKYPVWAWYQWNGVRHRKPDLRYSAHLPRGTSGVRIELVVDTKEVLLSDFDDFNCVLNYGYMTDTEKEYNRFYNEFESNGFCHDNFYDLGKNSKLLNYYRAKLYNSWERIFDLKRDILDEAWSGKKEERSIQATLWEVKWGQVISAKQFIAR